MRTAEAIKEVKKVKEIKLKTLTKLSIPDGMKLDSEGEVVVGKLVIVNKEIKIPSKEELVGDRTSDNYEFLIKEFEKINTEIKRGSLIGRVVCIEGDYLTLDLKQEFSFTLPLNEVVNYKKTFFFCPKDNVCPLKSEKVEDTKEPVFEFMIKNELESLQETCETIQRRSNEISDHNQRIKNCIIDIDSYKTNVRQKMMLNQNELIQVKKTIERNDDEKIETYYNSIMKNPSVKSLDIIQYDNKSCLLVTTNDLEYTSKNYDLKFVIGAYKILFNGINKPIACNYTKNYANGQDHHPCVSGSFSICTGSAFGDALDQAIKNRDYANAIHMLIDFLKEPDYGNPFVEDKLLIDMQPIDKQPASEDKWFSRDFWRSLKWDTDKYKAAQNKSLKNLKRRGSASVAANSNEPS